MRRHDLDPLSGALGVAAVVAGGLVMTGSVDRLDLVGVWLVSVAAAAIGLMLISVAAHIRQDERNDLG